MTQEMGESLIYSWLRHVKGCQIVQTNWKLSPIWELKYANNAKTFFNRFKLSQQHKNIIGNNTFMQTIHQAECDVVGIDTPTLAGKKKVYAVEVAYHRDGLHYRKGANAAIKKLLNAALCVYSVFGNIDAEIIFATPKVNNINKQQIDRYVRAMNFYCRLTKCKFKFRLLSNDQFEYNIIHPVYIMSRGVNDTSELFLRSVQLLQLFAPPITLDPQKSFDEFGKVGQIANKALRSVLCTKTINQMSIH